MIKLEPIFKVRITEFSSDGDFNNFVVSVPLKDVKKRVIVNEYSASFRRAKEAAFLVFCERSNIKPATWKFIE